MTYLTVGLLVEYSNFRTFLTRSAC